MAMTITDIDRARLVKLYERKSEASVKTHDLGDVWWTRMVEAGYFAWVVVKGKISGVELTPAGHDALALYRDRVFAIEPSPTFRVLSSRDGPVTLTVSSGSEPAVIDAAQALVDANNKALSIDDFDEAMAAQEALNKSRRRYGMALLAQDKRRRPEIYAG